MKLQSGLHIHTHSPTGMAAGVCGVRVCVLSGTCYLQTYAMWPHAFASAHSVNPLAKRVHAGGEMSVRYITAHA